MRHLKRRVAAKAAALLCGLSLAACGSSSGGDTGGGGTGGGNGTGVIGPAGGTVSLPSGPTVVVPGGALTSSTTISVAASSIVAPTGAVSGVYQFGPEGTTFTSPVTVSFPVPAGTTASKVAVYWTKPGSTTQWDVLPATVSGTTATASVTHFSAGFVGAACAAGAACAPANACHTGTTTCNGTPACVDTGTSLADGAACGGGNVCTAGVCGAAQCIDMAGTWTITSHCDAAYVGKSVVLAQTGCTVTTNDPVNGDPRTLQVSGSSVTLAPSCSGTVSGTIWSMTCGTCAQTIVRQAQCVPNLTCTPPGTPDVCKTYATSCDAGGVQACGATGNKPDLTPCGTGLTCLAGTCGPVPSAPLGVVAQGGNGQVTISWNPVQGAASYNAYWSTSSGLTPANGTRIAQAASPYVKSGLANGVTYYFVVTALNAHGESTSSSRVSATPSPPTYAISGTVSGAVTDGVLVTLGGSAARTAITSGGGAYSFSGLANGTYTVTPALGGQGFSPPSRQVMLGGVSVAGQGFTATAVPTTYPVQIPRTGQVTSVAAGDDGALQKGAAWPSPRFTDGGNGTVTDNLTGLVWLKNANCFGVRTWTAALSSANQLASGSCGLTDGSTAGQWRLPNIRELQSLRDAGRSGPAVPAGNPFTSLMPNPQVYWSSTSSTDSVGTFAWYMHMYYGMTGGDLLSTGSAFLVLPVRSGPSSGTAPVQLPRTGQTTSYGVGDDGVLQEGVASPNPRFTDAGDGTVTDNLTGLLWLKNASCFGKSNWASGVASARGMASGACGLSDGSVAGEWRLPNLNELQSLLDYSRVFPAIPAPHPFSAVQPDDYWSATATAGIPNTAWQVSMYSGTAGSIRENMTAESHNAWPVRSPRGVVPPANVTAPSITGTAAPCQRLTAGDGTWTGLPVITYSRQWRRCDASGASCSDIAGATATTYAVTLSDVGTTIRVAVTAINGGGALTAASAQTEIVQAPYTVVDGDFGAWLSFSFVTDDPYVTSPGPGTSAGSSSKAASGGNPGAYLATTQTVTVGDTVWTGGIKTDYSYAPAVDGPISTLSISADLKMFTSGASAWQLVVDQGGRRFYSFPFGAFSGAWATVSAACLTTADFDTNPWAGNAGVIPDGIRPDFGASAPPLRFGFLVGNRLEGSGTGIASHGVDNFSLMIGK